MQNVTNIENAKQYGRRYFARHMVQGVVRYTDSEGRDFNVLVKNEAIASFNKSFEGKPLYVGHLENNLEKLEEEAAGYVVKSFFNELDSWWWAEIIVTSDAGHDIVNKGISVSNAYWINKEGSGGTYLNVPYEHEVLEGEFLHLALVPNPRYEEAEIMNPDQFLNYCEGLREKMKIVNNSKESKRGGFMKFWKSSKEEVQAEAITNESDLSSYTVEVEGSEVALSEMLAVVRNAKAEEEAAEEKKENMKKTVNVDGEEMTVEELVNKYKNLCKKKNAEEEEEELKNSEEEKAEEKEKKENEKEAKENAGFVEQLKNARDEGVAELQVTTQAERLAKGKEGY